MVLKKHLWQLTAQRKKILLYEWPGHISKKPTNSRRRVIILELERAIRVTAPPRPSNIYYAKLSPSWFPFVPMLRLSCPWLRNVAEEGHFRRLMSTPEVDRPRAMVLSSADTPCPYMLLEIYIYCRRMKYVYYPTYYQITFLFCHRLRWQGHVKHQSSGNM